MFDAQNQGQQPDPKAMCKAHKSAIKFHKAQAQKAGLDSPLGQAHVNALQTHMGALNKLKSSIAGASGKQSPVPVPKKSEQPSEDIRQQKPAMPLAKLQQNKREAINRFGMKKREADGPDAGTSRENPDPPRKIMKPDLVFRGKKPRPASFGPKPETGYSAVDRANESRRSLRRKRPIWESDDSERDRSSSGLTA